MSRLSQQNRLILLPLVGAIALVSLLGLFLAGRKRVSKPVAKVARHRVETPAEEVQKYWTAERMQHAKPVPMPHVTDAGEGKQQKPRQPQA
jgi:hypothetical protein